jgi:hypothetical protein
MLMGTIEDSDIVSVKLFEDADQSGNFSTDDLLIYASYDFQPSNSHKLVNFEFTPGLEITVNDHQTFFIVLDISPGAVNHHAVGVKVDRSSTTSNGVLTVDSALPVGGKAPSTYIGEIPEYIIIDGAFADWNEVHNYVDTDDSDILNDNVDINEFRIDQDSENVSFYFRVKGTMMGGSRVPMFPIIIPPPAPVLIDSDDDGVPDIRDPHPNSSYDMDGDGWSDDYEDVISFTDYANSDTDGDNYTDSIDLDPNDPSIPPPPIRIPPEIKGQDSAYIFIDTDTNPYTGYRLSNMEVGAEYMIEISGKYGYIFNSSYNIFNGSTSRDWNWSYIDDIDVGIDAERLETQINLTQLGLINSTVTDIENKSVDFYFIITDWANMTVDTPDCTLNNLEGMKETLKSINVLNMYTNATGFDWIINFKTTGCGRISIGNHSFPYELDFKGLYYYNPVTNTYLLMNVEIDIENRSVYADWRYELGKIVFKPHNLTDNHTVQFLFGDFAYAYYNIESTRGQSPPTSNDTNIDLNISDSLRSLSSIAHSLSNTRNPAGTNVVINEIFPDKKSGEWIELYNPTGGTIDLSGWTITTSAGSYTFPGTPGSATVTIGPGQFLIIDNTDFGDSFLKNKEDDITLSDYNSNPVDFTNYKGVPDGQSWARYRAPDGSDGWDTDQPGNWYKEPNPTKGSSNNVMIPEYELLLLPLGIVLLLMYVLTKRKNLNEKSTKSEKNQFGEDW